MTNFLKQHAQVVTVLRELLEVSSSELLSMFAGAAHAVAVADGSASDCDFHTALKVVTPIYFRPSGQCFLRQPTSG